MLEENKADKSLYEDDEKVMDEIRKELKDQALKSGRKVEGEENPFKESKDKKDKKEEDEKRDSPKRRKPKEEVEDATKGKGVSEARRRKGEAKRKNVDDLANDLATDLANNLARQASPTLCQGGRPKRKGAKSEAQS